VAPENLLNISVDIVMDRGNTETTTKIGYEECPGTAICSLRYVNPAGGDAGVENAVLSIITPNAIVAEPSFFNVNAADMFEDEGKTFSVRFRIGCDVIPESTNCTVVAGFLTGIGVTKAKTKKFRLPIAMLCRGLLPVKNNLFMFTLRCSVPPIPPSELFKDVFSRHSETDSSRPCNAISLQLLGSGAKITLLLSKKGGKLRVQSGCFEALWLITAEVLGRLSAEHEGIKFEYAEALPLQDYFAAIEKH